MAAIWQSARQTFGTRMLVEPDDLAALEEVLDRRRELNSLRALASAALSRGPQPSSTSDIAFGFDTSVVLRLADTSRIEVVDFLASRHKGPLVLPGQVVQEFWKNELAEIKTIGAQIQKKYQGVAEEVRKLPLDVTPFADRFQALVDEFAATYSLTFDEATETRIRAVLDVLQAKAYCPYVPRMRFAQLAAIRDDTKTPPGFRDAGHGDFFVWADFLLGLLIAKRVGRRYELAVLVTDDKKDDWSRGGQAHPVLMAEVTALVAVPFETWDIKRLTYYVTQRLADTAAATATRAAPAEPGAAEAAPLDPSPSATVARAQVKAKSRRNAPSPPEQT